MIEFDSAESPILSGKHARLRPVLPGDYPFLYIEAMNPEMAYRWRLRGSTPSPEQFTASLWDAVLCQFIIESVGGGEAVGLVAAAGADFRNGHVHLHAMIREKSQRTGWAFEGIALHVLSLHELVL
jgi:hypothetical protein